MAEFFLEQPKTRSAAEVAAELRAQEECAEAFTEQYFTELRLGNTALAGLEYWGAVETEQAA